MDLTQLFRHWTYRVFSPGTLLRRKYEAFKSLLSHDRKSLELIAQLEEISYGDKPVDWARVARLAEELRETVSALVSDLMEMSPSRYMDLADFARKIDFYVGMSCELPDYDFSPPYVMSLSEAGENPFAAGGKAEKLSRVAAEGIPAPPGFVVTAGAFFYCLEYNELRPRLDRLLSKIDLEHPGFTHDVCNEMQRLILESEIPPEVERALRDASTELAYSRGGTSNLAVRSSAYGEDAAGASFAGQYESVLDVGLSDLRAAYKEVLAGKYGSKAVTYRIRYGLADTETPMAALVLPMLQPRVSGVIYTRGFAPEEAGELSIYCVEGPGRNLVSGSASPEVAVISRGNGGGKARWSSGGLAPQAVKGEPPGGERLLDDDQIRGLAEWAMRIEELFGEPQDIEWCLDVSGEIYILQARPLLAGEESAEPADGSPEIEAEPLLKGGITASPGVGVGQVCHCPMVRDLEELPERTVLVAETLSPEYAGVIERLAAVVTDTGSRASHFASVAREFGLPVIVDTKFATRELEAGSEVTVHADGRAVYPGRVEALVEMAAARSGRRETPFHRRLELLMKFVSPLNLTDPDSEAFKPSSCRSMHDLTRFCHEMGVAEMFDLVGKGGRGLARAKELDSEMPLYMYVLDLDGGLDPRTALQDSVEPKDFASPAMVNLWRGITHKSVDWSGLPPAYDWDGYERMSGGLVSPKSKALSSYAVLSHEYVHVMLRFGYHFAMVDAMVVGEAESNYVNFRFKGGGGLPEQRRLRIKYISEILGRVGFKVKVTGDLLDASFQRQRPESMLGNLRILGVVLGKTRLLDMSLREDMQVESLVEEFFRDLDMAYGAGRES